MTRVALDAGALIAIERDDHRFWRGWAARVREGADVVVPAAALAQVWRGATNARLAMLVNASVVWPLDEQLARRSGELLAASGTSDAVDASVVVTAAATRCAAVLTSDGDDLGRLVPFIPSGLRVVTLDDL